MAMAKLHSKLAAYVRYFSRRNSLKKTCWTIAQPLMVLLSGPCVLKLTNRTCTRKIWRIWDRVWRICCKTCNLLDPVEGSQVTKTKIIKMCLKVSCQELAQEAACGVRPSLQQSSISRIPRNVSCQCFRMMRVTLFRTNTMESKRSRILRTSMIQHTTT